MEARPAPLSRSERCRLLARLGLQPDARPDAIRHAYRRLALALHPDHGGDPADTADFRSVEDAYRRLVADDRAVDAATTRPRASTATETAPGRADGRRPDRGVGQQQGVEFAAGPVRWSPVVEGPDR